MSLKILSHHFFFFGGHNQKVGIVEVYHCLTTFLKKWSVLSSSLYPEVGWGVTQRFTYPESTLLMSISTRCTWASLGHHSISSRKRSEWLEPSHVTSYNLLDFWPSNGSCGLDLAHLACVLLTSDVTIITNAEKRPQEDMRWNEAW